MPGNKARAQAFWTELFNAHDLRNVRGFLAPGFVNHNARPGTPDGIEGAGQVFSRLWAGCSDMHFDLQAMVAEGSKVVCIGVMAGTHDGPFHGMPATHRPTAARQIHVLTFNDTGLITEHLAVRDDITVLRQLGALPHDHALRTGVLDRVVQATTSAISAASFGFSTCVHSGPCAIYCIPRILRKWQHVACHDTSRD